MDESEPSEKVEENPEIEKSEESAADEPGPSEPKKNRRRSSMGGEILNNFLALDAQETMSPVEVRARPRRAAQLKVAPAPVAPAPRQKPIRYSFDVGERVETKSCLKPTTAPILLHKGLQIPKKSVAQRAAKKIVEKYKNLENSETKIPVERREGLLKFHNICTIRVISPRPEYNPDRIELPHSDDEEEPLDPNRERLSTVALRLTPTSERQLEELQEHDVVQFNAEMVFGDRDEQLTELIPKPAEVGEHQKDQEDQKDQMIPKKRSNRRKSLIVGGASPLKIEKPRFDEIMEEISEPKRRTRKSTRLQKSSSESSDSLEILEEPSKKRELAEPESTSEPAAKKNRRKSCAPNAPESSEEPKKTSRRKSGVLMKAEKSEESSSLKIHDFFKKPEEKEPKIRANRRRSTRFVLKPDEQIDEDGSEEHQEKEQEVIEETPPIAPEPKNQEEMVIQDAQTPPIEPNAPAPELMASKSPEQEHQEEMIIQDAQTPPISPIEPIAPAPNAPNAPEPKDQEEIVIQDAQAPPISKIIAPTPKKLAPMFLKSPKTPKEPLKSTTEIPTTPKLFSLFSPKPKTGSGIPEKLEIVVDLGSPSNSTSNSTVSSEPKRIGIRREERWGDYYPETYQYLSNMILEPKEHSEEPIFLKNRQFRKFEPEILEPGFKILEIYNSKPLPTVLTSNQDPKGSEEHPEKVPAISGLCPLSVTPSSMADLNEGSEEQDLIVKWLRKWKRRVRKEAEKEMKKSKKPAKKGRRRGDEEDSDEEYEVEEDPAELENPLVLIGPTGVGKSALIRVLAKRENMRILSIGPESERTGSEIKKKLQEAMKSHRVDTQGATRRLTSFFANGVQQGGYTRKEKTVLDKDYPQSLIVFEHVDVFFDGLDRHGVTAVLEAVNEAVVPVIFTADSAEWPRCSGGVELYRPPMEIGMVRKGERTWKCVQKLIYSCRHVFIDDKTMLELSESVHHDLRALLNQANFYALAPNRPLPLTSRAQSSDGFQAHWELEMTRKPKKCPKNSERVEELYQEYAELVEIDGLFRMEQKSLKYSEQIDEAFDALRGRFSRRNLCEDVLPLLIPIDKVEKRKMGRSRRHLHRFKEHSDEHPRDGEVLMRVVGAWEMKN